MAKFTKKGAFRLSIHVRGVYNFLIRSASEIVQV
ncbi:hypothetical protein PM8797T_12293 [Gimesia maris DSM 8797]|nr:hypothetical protein PM8797T_12293 [Gimesia maris DSM 8797]